MMAHRYKHQIDEWIITHLEPLLASAVQRGEISFDEDPAFVARALNLAYLAEMRDWIMAENPKPAEAISNLRRLFAIQLHGLNYKPARRRKLPAPPEPAE
jgi:hypothetical protein